MTVMNDPIELRLSAEEINLILESLGQQPFVKVYSLIGKIQSQASAQLSASAGGAAEAGDYTAS